jgi:hypothetical protein
MAIGRTDVSKKKKKKKGLEAVGAEYKKLKNYQLNIFFSIFYAGALPISATE